MRTLPPVVALALVVSLTAAVAGCPGVAELNDCTPDELAQGGCDRCPGTCTENADTGAEAATPCAGSCVPLSLPEWSEAILLWHGPTA
jgi:hypothetical protein